MKKYRTGLEKHNAPYRGVSSRYDFTNFYLSVAHDLLHNYNVSGENPAIKGHKQQIQDLLSAIIEGNTDITTAEYTAGTIKKVIETMTDASNLSKWRRINLTFGDIEKVSEEDWLIKPPEINQGFLEYEFPVHVKPGDKIMFRFKPEDWDGLTHYQFGAINFDSSGDRYKSLQTDSDNSYMDITNRYFEYTLRFDEERDARLSIRTNNSSDGNLRNTPITLKEFGVYLVEETPVYRRGFSEDIIPMVNDVLSQLKYWKERRNA